MFEAEIDTPLGPMIAAGDGEFLYLLEFIDQRRGNLPAAVGKSGPIEQIERELCDYFSGKNGEFKTPLALIGSPFQKRVWEALRKIPFGQTTSYAAIAASIGKAGAFRAVGLANGANRFAIVIPCHRVINRNGDLGGYSGGIEKKEWLLKHERCPKTMLRV